MGFLVSRSAASELSPYDARADISGRRRVQQLYPEGSVSWTNLQRQLEALSPNGTAAQ